MGKIVAGPGKEFIEIAVGPDPSSPEKWVKVEARVFGPLAVHHTYEGDVKVGGNKGAWSITHVPTGMSLTKSISDERNAVLAVREMLEMDVVWDEDRYQVLWDWFHHPAVGSSTPYKRQLHEIIDRARKGEFA